MNNIDLNNPPPNHKYSVSVEREETDIERNVRLFKDVELFSVAIGFVIVISWLCFNAVPSSTTSPEEKKRVMSIPSAATGGIIGYLVRK